MDRYTKFLERANSKLRKKVREATRKIAEDDWSTLDIKPLKGWSNIYWCRVGDVRIIIQRESKSIRILDADFRSTIYKRWRG